MKSVIRRILVPLDPSDYAISATETACQVAWIHDSQVAGVAVLDTEEIRSSVIPSFGSYHPSMSEVVKAKVTHAKNRLAKCLESFENSCHDAVVTHLKTEYELLPVQKFTDYTTFFDLVVVGLETSFHFEKRGRKADSLADLLDCSITPVLAVPSKAVEKFDTALIALDGRLASARAMQDFASFAEPFELDVTVLVAGQEPEKSDFLLKSAREFLRSHGIERVTTESSEAPIEEVADDDYLARFDLIVVGIHSQNSLKDSFVGSFTRSLIERKTMPLFLSH